MLESLDAERSSDYHNVLHKKIEKSQEPNALLRSLPSNEHIIEKTKEQYYSNSLRFKWAY